MIFRELSFSRLECGVHDRLHIYPLCGVFYFPWHRHQIEGTNGFYCLIRKTERFTISNVESQVFTPNNSRLPWGLNAGGPRPKRVSYHCAGQRFTQLSYRTLEVRPGFSNYLAYRPCSLVYPRRMKTGVNLQRWQRRWCRMGCHEAEPLNRLLVLLFFNLEIYNYYSQYTCINYYN